MRKIGGVGTGSCERNHVAIHSPRFVSGINSSVIGRAWAQIFEFQSIRTMSIAIFI